MNATIDIIRTRPAARLWVPTAALILILAGCAQPHTDPTLELQATPSFAVRRDGATYYAESPALALTYSGTLKAVVEGAANELTRRGGGSVNFTAGDFDLGTERLKLVLVTDVTFAGQGMDATVIRNSTDEASDSEPFDCSRCDRLTIRDLTVSAGGAPRSTSDALDFDGGDDILIERVKVTMARGRGIVFDGKDDPARGFGTADRNVIRGCVITGVPLDGIQLLASNDNLIENCQIRDVGRNGIMIHKATAVDAQPHKPSNDNLVRNNHIENAGVNGLLVASGNRNRLLGNTVLNSSDDNAGYDGIRVASYDNRSCDDNVVDGNTASDNQAVKTQRYGLHINSANCRRTVVGTNTLTGNLTAPIRDAGTGTVYGSPSDTAAPTAPTDLTAVAAGPQQVDLGWTAATDNVGVTGYEVFRNGGLLAAVGNVTAYADLAARPNTAYSYQVRARDAAGNRSALSPAAAVTTPAPSGTSLTFSPLADTYLRSDQPGVNFGRATSLQVDGSPAKHTLLKFDVSGVGSDRVMSAVVRLYNTDAATRGGDFYAVQDTTWSETGVTWNTAPAADAAQLAALGGVTPGTWVEATVTAAVVRDGVVSFKIVSPSSNGADYSSREGSAGLEPQLVVTVDR